MTVSVPTGSKDGSEGLTCYLLRAGEKYEEFRVTDGLPAVAVTAESRALSLQGEIVVRWHPSSHNRASQMEVLRKRPTPLLRRLPSVIGLRP